MAISDVVGVMRQGNLEQLGTPEEIYTRPASRFVAEFVTQANFLPATRKGELWETEIGSFPVEGSQIQDTGLNTGELMIRQEDLILKATPDASVNIRSRRFLGREYRYCLETLSGKEIHARTLTDTVLPEGASVEVAIAHNALQIFSD